MPYSEPFNDGGAFDKMRQMARCPFATGAINPNYVGIRRESFADRNFGMPANVGSTAGSIEDFEVGGQSALVEGGQHIAFATRHRGSKEAMRDPYNTFSGGTSDLVEGGYRRAPDAVACSFGKERFVGSTMQQRQIFNGGLPLGIHYT